MTGSQSEAGAFSNVPVRIRRKLIEVALPLEAINVASAREKSIRHGHPSTLHLWWARRPLAAARAVIFSQMVDDPSEYVDVLREDPKLRRRAETVLKARLRVWEEARDLAEKAKETGLQVPEPGPAPTLDDILADQERQRLFRIIEDLVLWENTTNKTVLQAARDEIWNSWRRTCLDNIDHPRAKELFNRHVLPAFHDPFAGGGALPLEAQRLGLESYASDLNPVAVLINKAMIEIPPKFVGRAPANPRSRADRTLLAKEWRGAEGLAEDVLYYGQWMRDEAERRIGHLYPKIEVTAEMARERPDLKRYLGQKLTVTAWIWARTVKSPNPAFADVSVPLASTFLLSAKLGRMAYLEPVLETDGYRFSVRVGTPPDLTATKMGTTASRWNAFRCLMSGVPIPYEYIRQEGLAGRLGVRLMAIVAEGTRERVYLSPDAESERLAATAEPVWAPESEINFHPRDIKTQIYGLTRYRDLFTPRQLVALSTFSDLVGDARRLAKRDAVAAGWDDDGRPLDEDGQGPGAYAEAVAVYLAFALSKVADRGSALTRWMPARDSMYNTFSRQALPMSWDFVEVNSIGQQTGGYAESLRWTVEALEGTASSTPGSAFQLDVKRVQDARPAVFSTDPPYYDNIGYADLSDFFYVWLRPTLKESFPGLFATLAVPKADELVASPYRHGGKDKAEAFFLDGMTEAMRRLAEQGHPAFPITIYYAFKQSESDGLDGTASTGWETFLGAVIRAGFALTGTWPMRTELSNRLIGKDANALASSIVLVCRRRDDKAGVATRREFLQTLKAELPGAVAELQRSNVAPVDLAQAAIGPGMAVFTRNSSVIDTEANALSVRQALAMINQVVGEVLTEQEGDFDADSRWALAWYEQYGFSVGPYGVAETLSVAKNTSVDGIVDAGVLASKAGEVRLLRPSELDSTWDPQQDRRRPAWQSVHQLVLAAEQGEAVLADLIRRIGPEAEIARELAYRLFVLANAKKRYEEAGWYNGLVQAWPEVTRLALEAAAERPVQGQLFGEA